MVFRFLTFAVCCIGYTTKLYNGELGSGLMGKKVKTLDGERPRNRILVRHSLVKGQPFAFCGRRGDFEDPYDERQNERGHCLGVYKGIHYFHLSRLENFNGKRIRKKECHHYLYGDFTLSSVSLLESDINPYREKNVTIYSWGHYQRKRDKSLKPKKIEFECEGKFPEDGCVGSMVDVENRFRKTLRKIVDSNCTNEIVWDEEAVKFADKWSHRGQMGPQSDYLAIANVFVEGFDFGRKLSALPLETRKDIEKLLVGYDCYGQNAVRQGINLRVKS